MPSILPGYTYDIFISYRHKDNKYDGWVTEFVQNLKKELDATFKDEISIYFDFNPEDGLLETHNVNKSLEGKLNCLIFIPILSQTYCDPRSFAWQSEFCAFNKLAKESSFGRDISLRSGNVASRILPIRVRELDEEDKKLLEDELQSVLRPIDFIYKEQGVNRPLKPEDPEERNLNHTKYRNQINKTANAIKEITTALKWKQSGAPEPPPVKHTEEPVYEEQKVRPEPAVPRKEKEKKTLYNYIRLLFGIGLTCYFIFFFNKNDKDDENDNNGREITEKSIAVLPFKDMSAAHDQEYFSDGIAEEILNSLAHINGLKVAGRTSSFQFKGQDPDLKDVGKKLNVSTVLEGSVRKVGNKVRITAQLIGVKDGYHIWSETYDRDLTDIFAIQDEVANKIASVLLKEMAVTTTKAEQTENVKAFEFYLEGKYINLHQFVSQGKKEDFARSEDLFKKALKLDPNYALAHAGIADLYNTYTNRIGRDTMYLRLQQKEIDIALALNPNLDYVQNTLGQVQMTMNDYNKAYESFVKAYEINPSDGNNLTALSIIIMRLGLLDEALPILNKAVAMEPLEVNNLVARGSVYFQLGKFEEAKKDILEVLKLDPDNYPALFQLAYLYMIEKNFAESKKYIDKANAVNPASKGKTGLEATYEAALGHREAALKLTPDFRTYALLGMKKEAVDAMMQIFSRARPPLNFYLSLVKSAVFNRLADDPRIKELIETQRQGYFSNKAKFKVPAITN